MDTREGGGRRNISSGAPWEPLVSYSRAVRVGAAVYVSGTTSIDDAGQVVGAGDPYAQARRALEIVARALERAGARLEHVVRTRMYVTRIADGPEIGRAHGEVFGSIRPATTMVEVSALIDPRMLVEIEADAVVVSA